tara:strand:+ start:9411 stop:10847 length:1437 start_codon:yes stop_codon:yes gene_type:complete
MASSAVKKYINDEIEISKYKILSLNRIPELKPSQKRVLDIEQELCSIPFDELGFLSVSEAATAFRIFRESRSVFYDVYLKDFYIKKDRAIDLNSLSLQIESKLDFLKESSNNLIHIRPQEINLIQDNYSRDIFFNYISNKNKTNKDEEIYKFKDKNITEYQNFEPSIVSKFRARKQISTLSAGKYIEDKYEKLSLEYTSALSSSDFSSEKLILINNKINNVFFNLNKNIYKNYNYAINNMYNHIENTMGDNKSFSKINFLKDCLDYSNDIPRPINLTSNADCFRVQNILYGSKEPIKYSFAKDKSKGVSTKTYGILFPIKRVGNEKITPLHLDIWTNFNVCINKIICDRMSNVKAVDPLTNDIVYYKCIFLLPMWRVLETSFEQKDIKIFVSKLLGMSANNMDNISCNSLDQFGSAFSSSENFADINSDKSSVLVPSTRSEEHFFSKNSKHISDYINNVSGYKNYMKKYTINNQIINV